VFTTTESVGFTAAATEAAYVVAVAAQPLNAEKGVCDAARGLTNSVLVSLTFGSLAPTAAEQARAGGRSMVVADHTGKRRVACCLRLPSGLPDKTCHFCRSFSCALPDAATKSDARGVIPDGGEESRCGRCTAVRVQRVSH
jgi:hypothetical protein